MFLYGTLKVRLNVLKTCVSFTRKKDPDQSFVEVHFYMFEISNSAGFFDFLSLSGLSKEESTAAFVNYLEWSHCGLQ